MLAEAQLFPLEKYAEQRLLTLKAELRKYKFHEIDRKNNNNSCKVLNIDKLVEKKL